MIELFYNQGIIIFFFLVVSMLYSSVGFGGGSSYLAILALSGVVFTQIRVVALLCNIVVVSGNVWLFYQEKKIDFKKILPLVSLSIPFAYLGSYLKISQQFYFILLGFTLFTASIIMWFSKKKVSLIKEEKQNLAKSTLYGGVIGFVSGLVGIGGGIFLAPLLHLTNWDTPKKIVVISSVFIFVNSIAGLVGQYSNSYLEIDWNLTLILIITVFIGGQIGCRISNHFLSPIQLKKATAILIAFVSLRIFWKHLF